MKKKPPADVRCLQNIFKQETAQYKWATLLDFSRLRATDTVITEVPDNYASFSEALWNSCFPEIPTTTRWHYTSISSLECIAQNRSIRLHSLEQRMGDGELTFFAKKFGLDGYLIRDADGKRVIDDLAHDLFYLSLASGDEPGPLWSFGEVRLRLLIEPVEKRAEIRQIGYASDEEENHHPFQVLRRIAADRFDRHFIPNRLSRIGAFALSFYYEEEAEVRLLVKRFGDSDPTEVTSIGGRRFIAVPLDGEHDRVNIKLLEVQCKNEAAHSAAANILESMGDLGVQLTKFSH